MDTIDNNKSVVRLNTRDDFAIALGGIFPRGHKIARQLIDRSHNVCRYRQITKLGWTLKSTTETQHGGIENV